MHAVATKTILIAALRSAGGTALVAVGLARARATAAGGRATGAE